jgi:hypothetical protein
MSKAPARDKPSVDELLASIREAIYDDGSESGGAGMSATRQAAVQSRRETDEGAGGRGAPSAPRAAQREPLREADYNGGAGGVTAPHGSMRGLRVSLDRDSTGSGRVSARSDDFLHLRQRLTTLVEDDTAAHAGKTLVTSSREGFSGILGGDVRLEEALARLSRAGRPPSSHELGRAPVPPVAPPAPPPVAPSPPRRQPLDSTAIEELAGRTLRPAIREAIDAELRALPEETQALPSEAQGFPQPSWESAPPPESYSRPPSYSPSPAVGAPKPPAAEYLGPLHDAGAASGEPYRPQAAPAPKSPPMLAPESAEQASSAFDRLAETIMAQATGGEHSVEDLVRELLRPMLKAWLDHNLPKLVERLVREEIERVARHGRR